MRIKVYSRTVQDDGVTRTRYEYNGSFGVEYDDSSLEDIAEDTLEAWAKMMDCFFEVLFVREGSTGVSEHAITYTMQDYR